MTVLNNTEPASVKDVGGTAACVIGCGTLCYLSAGSGTVIASATYLV